MLICMFRSSESDVIHILFFQGLTLKQIKCVSVTLNRLRHGTQFKDTLSDTSLNKALICANTFQGPELLYFWERTDHKGKRHKHI